MQRESRVRSRPNYDAVCFHAQQCAEKYLKARLVAGGLAIQKIHSLGVLLDQAIALEPQWEKFRVGLSQLSVFAVASRYPGESADRDDAADAVQACRSFRLAARRSLIPRKNRRGKRANQRNGDNLQLFNLASRPGLDARPEVAKRSKRGAL
jgi:HEPN domain-containing protein